MDKRMIWKQFMTRLGLCLSLLLLGSGHLVGAADTSQERRLAGSRLELEADFTLQPSSTIPPLQLPDKAAASVAGPTQYTAQGAAEIGSGSFTLPKTSYTRYETQIDGEIQFTPVAGGSYTVRGEYLQPSGNLASVCESTITLKAGEPFSRGCTTGIYASATGYFYSTAIQLGTWTARVVVNGTVLSERTFQG